MTNNSEQQNKDRVLKSLAIAGFVGLIIVISWLGIQVVKVLPNAFSSLASLADGVYNFEETTVKSTSNTSIADTDEKFTISWNKPTRAGSYAFSYKCADGLSVDMKDAQGNIKNLICETNYNIGTIESIELIAQSEKTRFVDLNYRIDFIPSSKTEPSASDESNVTIVNPDISSVPNPTAPVATTTPETPTDEEEPEVPVVVKPTTPTKPSTTVSTPVYTMPVSDSNGFTDLSVTFGGVGILENNVFKNLGYIDNDARGAVQFEVKNIGTKTSGTWSYVIELPNGESYTSKDQAALRPNERAVIAIGFTVTSTGAGEYSIKVTASGDTKTSNNAYASTAAITE